MPDTQNNNGLTDEMFRKIYTYFSVKNFISDLPRLLNSVMKLIYTCITKFYSIDEDKIKCNKAEIDYINATTIVAQNLTFKGDNGVMYRYDDIANRIAQIENRLNSITNVTRQEIDSITQL